MDNPIHVAVDDPKADTEWNDILRKHGVIPEKPPSPTPLIEEALLEARKQAYDNRLENKGLDELDELEDDEDAEFLEKYRKQRIAELSSVSQSSVFNQVYPLQKPDYSRDVTEASRKAYVLVHLTSSLGTNIESRLLTELWRELARKFGDVKFCEIRGDMCIEGYPNKNTPTILVYHDGDIKRQLVTLRELAGPKTGIKGNSSDLEQLLVEVGALKANDSRLLHLESHNERGIPTTRNNVPNSDSADDGSDWE
ncbi:MAG: hypothetical protein LQ343_001914 [Gyalolechia ehrenbergii]|nr:MAG: hypothetical protein LQ343_001914 [Gyalolechia ehrenbergii]